MNIPLAAGGVLPRAAHAAPALDVERVREDFPILRTRVHGKPLVYLDNAATSQKPRAVIDALVHYYGSTNANVHRGVHLLSQMATDAYEEARGKVRDFLNAGCLREVIFTSGATEAINLVASSYGRQHVGEGDEVVISWMEHHANIVPWQMLCQEKKAHLRVVPITEAGEIDLDEYERLLTPRTKMVALAHVSNVLGTINPVRAMTETAHRRGIPVLLDGAQAVPHLRVDVQELDCDFYAFSGHKMYGPTGIGGLYGKARFLELMPPYQGGGDMIRSVSFAKTTYNELPYKFEAGTPNIAGAIGLGAAIDYLNGLNLDAVAAHEHDLLGYATEALGELPGVRILGTARHKAAVVSLVLENIHPHDIGTILDQEGIAVRTGHHCCQPLMDRLGIPGTARASFALYNTPAEVDTFAAVLGQIVEEAHRRSRPLTVAPELQNCPGEAVLCGSARDTCPPKVELAFAPAKAPTPQAAADEIIDVFEFLDTWNDRYQYLMELGEKLPPMPDELKTECTRVYGCQSTVHITARKKPGTKDVLEFLADSDAELVRGLIGLLEHVFSGQRAADILAFDVEGFFARLGLEQHLTLGRRNGLASMVERIRLHAAGMV